MTSDYASALERAAAAAADQWGRATPNPTVGAVVLDAAGRVVATGVTEPAGGRHAEIVALDAAGDAARGGTMVVSLEPCDHTGRTGPCSQAIIAAGMSRVVYAFSDPNPEAAGGAQTLREAGLDVIEYGTPEQATDGDGEADPALQAVLEGPLGAWLHRRRTGRPRVTWKYAASLDGRSAAADGTSQWITGPAARAHTLARRSRYDAIVVGSGTLAADAPSLTARDAGGALLERQPLRCVMGLGEVPEAARVRGADGRFRHLRTRDPHAALAQLGEAIEVLLEGGPHLAGAFLAAGLVDRIEAYVAPVLLGAGQPALGPAGVDTIGAALRYKIRRTTPIGADVLIELDAPDTGASD